MMRLSGPAGIADVVRTHRHGPDDRCRPFPPGAVANSGLPAEPGGAEKVTRTREVVEVVQAI